MLPHTPYRPQPLSCLTPWDGSCTPWDVVLNPGSICLFTTDAAECNRRSIKNILSHLRVFGTENPPVNPGGRPHSLTPPVLEALFHRLIEKPGLYLDEMAVFVHDEIVITVSLSSIKTAISSGG